MRQTFALLIVAFVLAGVLAGGAPATSAPGTVSVRSGSWQGVPWTLSAIVSGGGRFCVAVAVAGKQRAEGCGLSDGSKPHVAPTSLSWVSSRGGTDPTFVAGSVVAKARHVSIQLSDGTAVTVPTIPPPHKLAPAIAFYITTKSCDAYPVSIIGRDDAGGVVASWKLSPSAGHPPAAQCQVPSPTTLPVTTVPASATTTTTTLSVTTLPAG